MSNKVQKNPDFISGRDSKLAISLWKRRIHTATMCAIWSSGFFWIYLISAWMLDGYVESVNVMHFTGLGEVFFFALFGGLFSGGLSSYLGVRMYKHPDSVFEHLMGNTPQGVPDSLISEGEKIIRGSKLTIGPSQEIIDKSIEDSKKGAEAVNEAKKKRGGKKIDMLPAPMLAGAPYPYAYENMALFTMGSAGSGKSQIIKELVYGIRKRGGRDKIIIYDRKPEYLPIFFQNNDIVICPADRRHTPWDLFAEIKGEQDIDGIVKSMFPDMPGTSANDKFWTDSARNVFRGIIIYLMNEYPNPSNVELCKFLAINTSQPAKLWELLQQNEAARFYASSLSGAEKQNATVPTSVLSTLMSYVGSFTKPEVAEKGWFSVKNWLRDPNTEGQCIFLMNPAKYESNYRSYFTVILDLALREMISLPNDINRRVWFIIDEFGSLFKLDSVIRLLAEGRSKGACTVIGTQDMAQIKQQYKDEVETLINNCNSKVIARVTSKDESKYLSEMIGEMEVEKDGSSSTISLDDNKVSYQMNDKNNDSKRERRNVVLPAEIMNLESLNYYVKFCEKDWFRNGIEYYPWGKHEIVPDFIERPKSFFDTNRLIH